MCIRLERFDIYSVLIFVTISAIHTVLGMFISDDGGFSYYLSAAAADFLIVLSLCAIKRLSSLILWIQYLSLAFIYINLFGWGLYEAYYKPTIYNVLCWIVYLCIAICVYKGGKSELAIDRVYSVLSSVFGVTVKRCRTIQKDQGTGP